MYGFSLWFCLCSVEHLDLSKASNVKYFREGSSEDESEQACYIVQGNDSLKVNSDTQLDDSACSSSDDHIDTEILNEKLSIVCEKLLEKYQHLKRKALY